MGSRTIFFSSSAVVEPLRGGGQLKEKAEKYEQPIRSGGWGGGYQHQFFFCVSSLSVECFLRGVAFIKRGMLDTKVDEDYEYCEDLTISTMVSNMSHRYLKPIVFSL